MCDEHIFDVYVRIDTYIYQIHMVMLNDEYEKVLLMCQCQDEYIRRTCISSVFSDAVVRLKNVVSTVHAGGDYKSNTP